MISAPILQRNHKFIDRAIAQWLDIHFGETSFDGRIVIGRRKHGGGVYTMTARSLSELPQYVMLMHASQKIDYYLTANTVSGVQRTQDGLFGLQNIVIDIDCHEAGRDCSALVQSFLWRAERDLWSDETLPRPNSVVRTGRGVQLWWAIKPCFKTSLPYYNRIKTGLLDHIEAMLEEYSELEGLEIDRAASSNAVGFFRMPCTYNTAAKRYGSLEILHSERYDTHELIGYVSPLERQAEPQREEKTVSVAMEAGDLIVLHNLHSTGSRRVMQLVKLRNLRDNETGEETRNNLNFAVYNALRMSCDHDDAMERLKAFNAGFKAPMTDRELEQTICSAERKGGYKYSNAKLIEFLEITQVEQDAIGLHPFKGMYKPWNHAKPNATRDAVRQARREGRDNKIIELYKEGVSQAEIARQVGVCRQTAAKIIRLFDEKNEEIPAHSGVLINSSINDCLLEAAVSAWDGQAAAVFPAFSNTPSRRDSLSLSSGPQQEPPTGG